MKITNKKDYSTTFSNYFSDNKMNSPIIKLIIIKNFNKTIIKYKNIFPIILYKEKQ